MKTSDATLDSTDTDLRRTLKHICRDKAYCLEFSGTTTGNAFLFSAPDTLTTSLHNLSGFLRAYWTEIRADQNEDIRIPLNLYQGGRLVFGARGDVATVSVSPQARDAVMRDALKYNPQWDRVEIRLSRKLGKPLTRASTPVVEGAELHVVGYIERTGMQSFSGRRIANPFGASAISDMFSPEGLNVVRFATYYGGARLSGAPVLNAKGKCWVY
ncbi:MAG: hypothetical protein HC902_11260, partial [Calothrix sp. SM1_5_4]|nr:hypothetical protein [Calothrix sp. SM1_5_4]